MKLSYLILFLLLCVKTSIAQQSDPDSMRVNLISQEYRQLEDRFLKVKDAGKADSALLLAKALNEWVLQKESDSSIHYASSLRYIGFCFSTMQKHDSAFQFYKSSCAVFEKTNKIDHPDYAASLANLGLGYLIRSDYAMAEKMIKKSLDIRVKSFGEWHVNVASSVNSLGAIYRQAADLQNAEIMLKRALAIRKKILGESNPLYAATLNNLGLLYCDIGDFRLAESMLKQALNIRIKNLGQSHPDVIASLTNIAANYIRMHDFIDARSYEQQAIEILRNLGIMDKSNSFATINGLGYIQLELGDYRSADSLIRLSLAVAENDRFLFNPSIAKCYFQLGRLNFLQGNYGAVDSLFKKGFYIYEKTKGLSHPDYIEQEEVYASLLTRMNLTEEAIVVYKRIFQKKASLISANFEWLSDNQKEFYWKKESVFYDKLSFFADQVSTEIPDVIDLNYDAALLMRGKLLETKISTENFYREIDEIREELTYRRRLLAKMESEGTGEKDYMDNLYREADSLDKLLIITWPEYARQKKNLSINWQQVQQHLDFGEAAIEFVRFKNERDSLYYYNALLIRKDDLHPKLIRLCREDDLKKIDPHSGFSAYYPLLWKPIEDLLNNVHTIYYAPVGELYSVPFHAIYSSKRNGDIPALAQTEKRGLHIDGHSVQTEANAEFLMDRYTLHQLTSTRYLAMGLKEKSQEQIGTSIALLGGVNYDYLPGINSNPVKKQISMNRSGDYANLRLPYLEGTKKEVEQIASALTNHQWQCRLLENNEATEENVIQQESHEAKSVLHFATHGYVFPEFDFQDTSVSKNSLHYSFRYSKNPMVRGGLLLAGANWAWTGSDTLTSLGAKQNGILTALEVSQLNLKNTKLAVLSACETGLGKDEGNEGSFGLKRAFKLAGVEQIIVSLWSVPDKETMELMTLFYDNLTQNRNPLQSFMQAQKSMRQRYPNEPAKWAGFVLVR